MSILQAINKSWIQNKFGTNLELICTNNIWEAIVIRPLLIILQDAIKILYRTIVW